MNKISKITLITITALQCIFVMPCKAQTSGTTFKLANVLQSDMVVQQGKPLKIWGKAPANDKIKLKADWTGKTITTKTNENGDWVAQVSVPKIKAGDFSKHTITVIHNSDKVVLSDILIGDVWFCAGQSNMDMMVKKALMLTYPGALNSEKEIAEANYPNIRLYKTSPEFKISPIWDSKGTWKICSPLTAGDFSAVAYFFGRELFLKLNIPIGLVVSAAPGASTQAFTKYETLAGDTLLKHTYLDASQKLLLSQHSVDSTGFFSKVTKPTLLYNGIINPFFNLSIKGITWYQGESNNGDKRSTYVPLFTSFLTDLRAGFDQGELPFYYVQIAPYHDAFIDSAMHKEAMFRETQESFLSIKNTGIAVTMDVGQVTHVHIPDKKSVGQRLAYNALYKTYDLKNTPYLGPHFESYKVEGNTIKITYKSNSIGTGLMTNDGQAPRHFYVAGDDHVFYNADAKIVGNEVWLNCDKVKVPVAIRYAFADADVTNLLNKEGLPAMAFRTDNWDK